MLFERFTLGGLDLANRIVMAPMTRSRANNDGVPSSAAPTYYAQRASAGLIVTEATQISRQGTGFINTSGIYSDAQTAAWSKVTQAVHNAGGRIFLQLWHVGRCSHTDFHNGEPPVAPSAITAVGNAVTTKGKVPFSRPRALKARELPAIVDDYVRAAENARKAGFDGVEVHGANGFLLDQFIRDSANRRTDAYGGSIKNRIRFPVEVAEAVSAVWGPERVGYRVSPAFSQLSMADSTPVETFTTLTQALNGKIAYLHVVEPAVDDEMPSTTHERVTPHLRAAFDGPLIACGGYDLERAEAALAEGMADLVAFGTPFIANPDLVRRMRTGATLASPDRDTLYGGNEAGYVDYPTLA